MKMTIEVSRNKNKGTIKVLLHTSKKTREGYLFPLVQGYNFAPFVSRIRITYFREEINTRTGRWFFISAEETEWKYVEDWAKVVLTEFMDRGG